MRPAGDERRDGEALSQVEGANTAGAVELVGRKGERIDGELRNVNGYVAHGLDRVGMEGHAMHVSHAGEVGDGFEGAYLVVGEHDGDKRGRAGIHARCVFIVGEGLFKICGLNSSACING